MYYLRGIINWVLSVLIGSLIIGLIISIDQSNTSIVNFLEDAAGGSGMFSFFSALFSIPFIVIMLAAKWRLRANETEPEEALKRINWIHFIISAIYISIAIVIDVTEMKSSTLIILVYMVVGQVIWHLEYRSYMRKAGRSFINVGNGI